MDTDCANISRKKPQIDFSPSPEILKEIELSCRTLPSFEQTLYEIKLKEHYSLETNEDLACRWKMYKDNAANKSFTPFQFPDHRELHFFLGKVGYNKEMSTHLKTDNRKKNILGPGVDQKGQKPIPNELFMKRSTGKKMIKNINHCLKGKKKKNMKKQLLKNNNNNNC